MNQIFLALGIETWKPAVVAVLIPPVPWLVLIVIAAWLLWRRRRGGWPLMVFGLLATWFSCTVFMAEHLQRWLLHPPEALSGEQLAQLRGWARDRDTTIVVLGGGRAPSPEFRRTSLSAISIERLRYGVWLSRQSGLPLAFAGGLGPGFDGPTEAELATAMAAEEFRHPLAWTEGESRDTRENAARTLPLLRGKGIRRIVLVTHQPHLPRAMRNFQLASAAAGITLEVLPAPVGSRRWGDPWDWGDFVPSNPGWFKTRYAVREWLGLMAGA